MLRIVQKNTKRSFALRLVGVLWTESRVCGSLLGFEVRRIRDEPFLWGIVRPRSCGPGPYGGRLKSSSRVSRFLT